MNPDRADILVGLGRVKMAAGQPAEALPLFQEADGFWRDFDPNNRSAGEAASGSDDALSRCAAATECCVRSGRTSA